MPVIGQYLNFISRYPCTQDTTRMPECTGHILNRWNDVATSSDYAILLFKDFYDDCQPLNNKTVLNLHVAHLSEVQYGVRLLSPFLFRNDIIIQTIMIDWGVQHNFPEACKTLTLNYPRGLAKAFLNRGIGVAINWRKI